MLIIATSTNKRGKEDIMFVIVYQQEDIPYPHGQFGTEVPNSYFNYCKVSWQLQQCFNQLWAVV